MEEIIIGILIKKIMINLIIIKIIRIVIKIKKKKEIIIERVSLKNKPNI